MCCGLYLENDAELEGKRKMPFLVFPLFKIYIYHQRDWKEESIFIVIALTLSYALIKTLIKHLQQETMPLRELMLSSNIWFYSNLVLTSYNCKDFACVDEVQL